jgi:hypothetical protein
VEIRSRLPWFERLKYWSELSSFLAQKDGEPLPYSGDGEQGLRLIPQTERGEMLERGITVLTFTLPGFSLDRRRAVVFFGAEKQDSRVLAPSFSGSLIYLKKTGSGWTVDHPRELPALVLRR